MKYLSNTLRNLERQFQEPKPLTILYEAARERRRESKGEMVRAHSGEQSGVGEDGPTISNGRACTGVPVVCISSGGVA